MVLKKSKFGGNTGNTLQKHGKGRLLYCFKQGREIAYKYFNKMVFYFSIINRFFGNGNSNNS